MKLKMRIRAKMLLFVLSSSILIMLAIGIFIGLRIDKIARENAIKIAYSEAEKTAYSIESELELDMGFSRSLAHALEIYPKFDTITLDSVFFNIIRNQVINNPQYLTVWYSVELWSFREGYTKDYGRRSVTAYLKNGSVGIDIEFRNLKGDVKGSAYYVSKTKNNELLIDPYNFKFGGKEVLATSISVPIRIEGRFAGLAGVDLSLEKFQDKIEKIEPYPNTIVSLIGGSGTIIADTHREVTRQKISEVIPIENSRFKITEKISAGYEFSYFSSINGKEYLNIYTPVKVGRSDVYWSVRLSIPIAEVVKDSKKSILYTILVFLAGILLQSIAIWFIAKAMSTPIVKTTGLLNQIAQGDIDINRKIFVHTGDEMEEMARSTNKLLDGLNHTERFARQIGEGKLDVDFSLLSDKDKLGKSLIEMQKNLKQAKELEEQRKVEEKQQLWITKGLALFSDVLRQHGDNLKELSYLIVKNLVDYTDSVQGGIFVVNDSNKEKITLDMTACYAYDRRKFMEQTILPNEGLVGRCYIEKKTIYMTKLPKNYIKITSGLGEDSPRCLIVVPLATNDGIMGVLEMASLQEYEQYQIEFIEKIATSIASTLASVKINMRTSELLARTQQQAEEMKAQEEEMRQNMEELAATQEEMERKRQEQERIQAQLREDKAILSSLLENSPDLIYQKDPDGKYIRASQSMLKLFNLETTQEILGLTDFDLLNEEQARKLRNYDIEVINTRQAITNRPITLAIGESEQNALLTLLPLTDENGSITGVLGVIKFT